MGVKINNQSFENGWAKFAEDNGLEVGDLLVFRHEGEIEFEIIVFDPTACEKDYPFEDEKQVHTREAVEFPLEKSVEVDNISGMFVLFSFILPFFFWLLICIFSFILALPDA